MTDEAFARLPRGIRNNNPGNIVRGDPWQGLAEDQSADPRFAVFGSPEAGIRAIARTLITYQDQYGIRTVRDAIHRWAPPVENNTDAYVHQVAQAVGVGPADPIDVHDYATMRAIVRAIIRHENGDPRAWGRAEWYPAWVIDEGLHRAGVIAPATAPRIAATPEVIGSGVAGAAGLTAAGAALTDSAVGLRHLSDGSIALTVIVTLLVVAGIALSVYGAMRRMRS